MSAVVTDVFRAFPESVHFIRVVFNPMCSSIRRYGSRELR